MAKITLSDGMIIEGTIEEFKQMGVKFPVEEVEVNYEYRKVAGRTPKAGDFVKYSYSPHDFIKVGKYYEIEEIDDGELFHIDEDGDSVAPDSDESFEVYEKLAPCCEPAPEPLKVGDYVKIVCDKTNCGKKRDVKIGEIRIIKEIDNDFAPYYAEKLDGSDYDYFRTDALVSATDEEVSEAKAILAEKEIEAKWKKTSRKPNHFIRGDIVRVESPCGSPLKKGDIVEVKYKSIGKYSVLVTDKGWAVSVSELIAPVEARFDR
jgi:hypothetical protein